MLVSALVFWVAVGCVFYAYAGYPLAIVILGFVVRRTVKKDTFEPTVTFLITAYNEEKDIVEKLENTLSLDYPPGKFQIVVASDGSSDRTEELVKGFAGHPSGVPVVCHRVEGRLGKTAAQNSAVEVATGEIVIFSDAASLYDKGAIRAFVQNFADASVGAVSGRCEYVVKKGTSVGGATKAFWALENFIKQQQTRISTLTGCTGCIYALRKALYTPLPPSIISDLVEPLTVLQQGTRIVYEPGAVAYEETAGTAGDEFKMRIRVIVRGMNGMAFVKHLYNPLRYPWVAFQLVSHKVMRWLVPVFAIVAIVASAVAAAQGSRFFQVVTALQAAFYVIAAAGWKLEKKGMRLGPLKIPVYFCVVNLASLISIFKFMKRENIVVWQTQR